MPLTQAFAGIPKSVANFAVDLGKFDANLTMRSDLNLDLTITLRVLLLQETGDANRKVKDSGGRSFEVAPWPHEAWMKFRATFQAEGERFWDNQFQLQHIDYENWGGLDYAYNQNQGVCYSDAYPVPIPLQMHRLCTTGQPVPGSGVVRPLVHCRFRLQVVPVVSKSSFHAVVWVAYLAKPDGGSQVEDFPSNSRRMTFDDLTTSTGLGKVGLGQYVPIKQRVFLHEIGHLFGQPHAGQAAVFEEANPQCAAAIAKDPKKGSNADPCYGFIEDDTANNIMGVGEMLSNRNALPWQHVLAYLTQTSPIQWPVTTRMLPPKILSAQPGGVWW
jgi:hypothetical protein